MFSIKSVWQLRNISLKIFTHLIVTESIKYREQRVFKQYCSLSIAQVRQSRDVSRLQNPMANIFGLT